MSYAVVSPTRVFGGTTSPRVSDLRLPNMVHAAYVRKGERNLSCSDQLYAVRRGILRVRCPREPIWKVKIPHSDSALEVVSSLLPPQCLLMSVSWSLLLKTDDHNLPIALLPRSLVVPDRSSYSQA
jgi:hypothetical protein